ncbi:MAG: Vesicle-fusing ATPase, partial [Caulobacter sp.]|nr:Vesicle-fusing ATPase [Caulobacter sp.]
MSQKIKVELVAKGDAQALHDAVYADQSKTLRLFLEENGCEPRGALDDAVLDTPLKGLRINVVKPEGVAPKAAGQVPAFAYSERELGPAAVVALAYADEIARVRSFLKARLSVLVRCEKLVAERLIDAIVRGSGLTAKRLVLSAEAEVAGPGGSRSQRHLSALRQAIEDLKEQEVLVLPHFDLLVGGGSNLSNEARESAEILYALRGESRQDEALILACVDPSLDLPEVIVSRFAVRMEALGVPKLITTADGARQPLGKVLVTADEAACFKDYDPVALYKNVAGMNPVRMREAIQYAVHEHGDGAPVPAARLHQAIRAFKAQTFASFEIPNVSFDEIGGYTDLKAELNDALRLMTENFEALPNAELQRELIPRGFLFYGPPGTGKTLFAKAIANALNATILVVSGPEVTDMYVGESERKVRDLFSEARRNAPAVLVFDEFDAIATKRSGRDDGGSRAGNAVVAQILTEMDGFRPEVPILVIGTTNQLSLIDPALLRPSRFRPIAIGLPDGPAREAIARVHAAKFRIEAP